MSPAVLDALHAGDLEIRRWTDRDRYNGAVPLMDHDAAYEPDYAARADARATLARVLALREGRALVALLLAPGVRSGAERERVRRLRAKVRDAIPAGCGYMVGGAK